MAFSISRVTNRWRSRLDSSLRIEERSDRREIDANMETSVFSPCDVMTGTSQRNPIGNSKYQRRISLSSARERYRRFNGRYYFPRRIVILCLIIQALSLALAHPASMQMPRRGGDKSVLSAGKSIHRRKHTRMSGTRAGEGV